MSLIENFLLILRDRCGQKASVCVCKCRVRAHVREWDLVRMHFSWLGIEVEAGRSARGTSDTPAHEHAPWAVVGGVAAEGDLQLLEELVHAREEGLGAVGRGVNAGLALVHYDAVCEVGGHDEVVLHDESGLLGVHDEALDHLGRCDTLLRVQIR